ncbi:GNAT family N-acetyltransferase [Isoptericola sp. S6320L]|uniref:GNAT family N-acetyltransferase n=1 Tax=Isoptericola sp. S6320L TaxID=2926411 RepID=UPI001FF6B291|nr:GNAT family N-acetyltransferase [Isoptericola sp. S6320L]MCK0115650.1 GNAT family N-acetyltransferase [Isoptericola sp. S6320L]
MSDDEFSADPARLDRARVHELLSEHAYWATGRTREAQDAAIAASRNYGIYTPAGEQIAYARAVTDGVTFAWLADVIVDPAHRGRGLGTRIVDGALADLDTLGLKRVLLKASPEARAVYLRAGFTELDEPDTWLQRRSQPR